MRRKLYFLRDLENKSASPAPRADGSARKEIELSKQEIEVLREALVRQRAEFDNFRKRAIRERDQSRDLAHEQLIVQLLPVLDNFDRALAFVESGENGGSMREGISMVGMQLKRMLEQNGLARLNALNAAFDPTQHDAIATEVRDDLPDNVVSEELTPGYRLKEKVIRAAMVKVSKKPAQG
jgi:molecular chaperone GrpE